MIYLDSSALLKLIIDDEQHSAALRAWLQDSLAPHVSSELAKVEVTVSTRRLDPMLLPVAKAVVARLDLLTLSGEIVDMAAELDMKLRSLDALHLCSAMALGQDLSTFVAYDQRLVQAAQAANLPVVSPVAGDKPAGEGEPTGHGH